MLILIPFLAFSDLTCHIEDTGIEVSWLHYAAPDSKETELGSSDQEASSSASKNTGVVLVQCRAWKCIPTAISGVNSISEVPRRHFS